MQGHRKPWCKAVASPCKRGEWLKIDWLNTLLTDHGLYQELLSSAQVWKSKAEEKGAFEKLRVQYEKTGHKEDLKSVVRFLMERAYPGETPKVQDRPLVKRLCGKIRADFDGIIEGIVTVPENSVAWLNAFIQIPDLYEQIIVNKGKTLDQTIQATLETLKAKYDKSQGAAELARLNRSLLEALYPQETPMSYQAWQGYQPMPELNLMERELQGRLYRHEDSVLQHYLRLGVDGFRFDAANDVGLKTIEDIRQALHERFLMPFL